MPGDMYANEEKFAACAMPSVCANVVVGPCSNAGELPMGMDVDTSRSPTKLKTLQTGGENEDGGDGGKSGKTIE